MQSRIFCVIAILIVWFVSKKTIKNDQKIGKMVKKSVKIVKKSIKMVKKSIKMVKKSIKW